MQRAITPSQISDSLHHRLNSYALAASAAGVGVLALAQSAEAKIVYTHVHKIIGLGVKYTLDLNHDHKGDFVISNNATWCDTDNCFRSLLITAGLSNAVQGTHPIVYSAFALGRGARIDSDHLLYGSVDMVVQNVPPGTSCLFGQWCDVSNRYLGLAFNIKGHRHYGWARLSVKTTLKSLTATLTGYAYETIPNKFIIAGKTHGGASLGALAAGSTALSGRRHKIRSK